MLCSDLHQHLLPSYNTSSTYPPYFTYIQSRPSERLLILSSPSSSSSSTFLQVSFLYSYLLPSSFSFVGERERVRNRERQLAAYPAEQKNPVPSRDLNHLHLSKICGFSVDSLLSHCLIEYASSSARDAALDQLFSITLPPRSFSLSSLYYPLLSSWESSLSSLNSRPPWTQIVILVRIAATSTLPLGWIWTATTTTCTNPPKIRPRCPIITVLWAMACPWTRPTACRYLLPMLRCHWPYPRTNGRVSSPRSPGFLIQVCRKSPFQASPRLLLFRGGSRPREVLYPGGLLRMKTVGGCVSIMKSIRRLNRRILEVSFTCYLRFGFGKSMKLTKWILNSIVWCGTKVELILLWTIFLNIFI